MEDRDRAFVFDSRVPSRHGRFHPLSDSTSEEWSKWYRSMKFKVEHGGIFGFIGKRGSGKTQMSVSLIGHLYYNRGKSSRYVKFSDLVEAIRSPDKTESFYSMLKTIPLLVIDALEVRKDSDFEHRELNRLLDARYDRYGLSTILISNDKREEFDNFVGKSITSRMNETGGVLEFNIESFRGE